MLWESVYGPSQIKYIFFLVAIQTLAYLPFPVLINLHDLWLNLALRIYNVSTLNDKYIVESYGTVGSMIPCIRVLLQLFRFEFYYHGTIKPRYIFWLMSEGADTITFHLFRVFIKLISSFHKKNHNLFLLRVYEDASNLTLSNHSVVFYKFSNGKLHISSFFFFFLLT